MPKVALYLRIDGDISFIKQDVDLDFLPPVGAEFILNQHTYLSKVRVETIRVLLSNEDYFSSSEQFWIYLNTSIPEDLKDKDFSKDAIARSLVIDGWIDRRPYRYGKT